MYVNDFCYYRNCLYTHRYKFSSEGKKKKGKESQYIVSRPELGSDPSIGSDRESGCDTTSLICEILFDLQDKQLLRIILLPLFVRFCLIYRINSYWELSYL